jgi:Kef-type K+ transport system membrane component KefB
MIALGQPWELALLLGAIAIETAPASTLMVIRECHGKGPVSDTMLGLIAVNNIFCLAAYSLAAALIKLTAGWAGWSNVASSLYQSLFPLVWQLAGSAALGFLVGLMLAGWAGQVAERGVMLILLAGSILLCVGVAQIFELSSLIASLSVGATMANLSPSSRKIFQALGGTDPPFYAIFFVIAGADLDVAAIPEMGLLGAGYVCARGTGKFVGARVGTRLLKMDPNVQEYLGFGLMAQAGLAVGLMMTTEQQFPQYAATIKTVILSSVTIFEMFGPIGARFAIVRAGEARIRRPDTGSIWALE